MKNFKILLLLIGLLGGFNHLGWAQINCSQISPAPEIVEHAKSGSSATIKVNNFATVNSTYDDLEVWYQFSSGGWTLATLQSNFFTVTLPATGTNSIQVKYRGRCPFNAVGGTNPWIESAVSLLSIENCPLALPALTVSYGTEANGTLPVTLTNSTPGSVVNWFQYDFRTEDWVYRSNGSSQPVNTFDVPVSWGMPNRWRVRRHELCADGTPIFSPYFEFSLDGAAPTGYNTVESWSYGPDGTTLGHAKDYFDHRGQGAQSQVKDIRTGITWVTDDVVDQYGRPALSALSAPIHDAPDTQPFDYVDDFLVYGDAQTPYTYQQFTNTSNEVVQNDPQDMATATPQLGKQNWYYQANHSLDPNQDHTEFPFAYGVGWDNGSGEGKRSAGATATFRMGSGHETHGGTLRVQHELDAYLGMRQLVLHGSGPATPVQIAEMERIRSRATLAVSIDPNNQGGLVISDARGQALMSAIDDPAETDWLVNLERSATLDQPQESFRVLHLLPTHQTTIGAPTNGTTGYAYYLEKSGTGLAQGYNAGQTFNDVGVIEITRDGYDQTVSNTFGLDNISWVFYNDQGQVVASVTPKGVQQLLAYYTAGTQADYSLRYDFSQSLVGVEPISGQVINGPEDLPYTTRYEYDFLGRTIAIHEPDAGTSRFKYTLDGKPRFSQTTEQANPTPTVADPNPSPRFSYINYDPLGRPITSGEYTGAMNWTALDPVLESIGETGGLDISFDQADPQYGNHRDWVRTYYDYLPPALANPVPATLVFPETPGDNLVITQSATHQAVVSVEYLPNTDLNPQPGESILAEVTGGVALPGIPQWTEGAVAYTEGPSSRTWFSYTQEGYLDWSAQQYKGLGFDRLLTVHYTYDDLGNVTRVAMNQGQEDAFFHHYAYNIAQNLEYVWTSRDSLEASKVLRARYFYNPDGSLRRTQLGTEASPLQGMDYRYTLSGALKAVNSPLDPTQDPDYTNPSVPTDIFAYGFDYYDGDYARQGAGAPPAVSGAPFAKRFDGLPNTFYYHTQDRPAGFSYPDGATDQLARGYNIAYDPMGQMTEARFGYFGANNTPAGGAFTPVSQYGETLTYDPNGNIGTLLRTDQQGNALDNLQYSYNAGGNSLSQVDNQSASASPYAMVPSTSYTYYQNGALLRENNGTYTRELVYNSLGLVSAVYDVSQAGVPKLVVTYTYDDAGNRIRTQLYDNQGTLSKSTYYQYDALGSLLTIYTQAAGQVIAQQSEVPIKGASRLGVAYARYDAQGTRTQDDVYFQLSDHLGNVRAVITEVSGVPVVLEIQDYYPFGRVNPWYSHGSDYRFGYQGEYSEELFEEDLDGDNTAGWNAFMLRMYDARIGRWLTVDPYRQHGSPYMAMGNNAIWIVDPDGGCDESGKPCPELAESLGVDPRSLFLGEVVVMGDKNYSLMQNSMIEANTGFWTYARTTLEWLPVLDLPFAISHVIEDLERGDYRGAILNGGTELLPGPNVFRRFRKARNAVSSTTRRAANAAEEVVDGASGSTKLLPQGMVPNAGGKIVSFTTTESSTYFRVYSSNPNGGAFLTKMAPKSSAFAREGLALPSQWNTASHIQKVTVPAGVTIQRSRALPAFGRRGGLEQFQILNFDSRIIFHPGVPLK